MPSIVLESVDFHYPSPYTPVFDQLSLTLDPHWRTGLVGRNGTGKTTLLGLLQGRLQPTRGRLGMPVQTMSFPYQPPDPGQPVGAVIRSAVAPFETWERELEALLDRGDDPAMARYAQLLEQYEEAGGYEIDARIQQQMAALELPSALLKRPFHTLSGGEQTRALIIALFLRPHAFPLIDEPTNHLDLAGRTVLGRYLARKQGFLVVSHDRGFLDLCVDHLLSINRSDVRIHHCDFSTWKRQMDREEAHEQRRSDNLRQEIRCLERSARKRRSWSNAKERQKIGSKVDTGFVGRRAAMQMKRALHIERRARAKLEEKKGLLANAEKKRRLKLAVADRAPERVLDLDRVTIAVGGQVLFENLSLTIHRGERVALLGRNGCGKSSLLRTILGELPSRAGAIRFPRHLCWAQSRQQPRWRQGYLREHLRDEEIDETRFRSIMGSFGVGGAVFDRPLESFSQGQRKKVDLIRSFLDPSHLLLWDEPLNYVDLASREQIVSVVLAHTPTLLFIEHDRAFVERVATRVIHLDAMC